MARVDSDAKQIGDPIRRWDKVLHFTVLNDTLAKMTLEIAYRRRATIAEPWLYDNPAFSCFVIPYVAKLEIARSLTVHFLTTLVWR